MNGSWKNAALLGAALIVAACDGGTTAVRDANLAGKWLYRGSIAGCDFTAVLRISVSGSAVSGTVPPTSGSCSFPGSGTGTLPADSNITVGGVVHGDSVTFTLHAWSSDLVHTAAIHGDSMAGTFTGAKWGGTLAGPGEFGARRYTTEVLPSRFRVAVSGAVTDTIEGIALSTQYGPTFTNDDRTPAGVLMRYGSAGTFPLVPGTYRIYDHTVLRDSLAGSLQVHGSAYRFRDGTATITAVGADHYQGTYEANGYLTTDTTQKIHAVAAFNPYYAVFR